MNKIDFESDEEKFEAEIAGKRVLPALSAMVNYIKPTPMVSLKNLNEITYFLTVTSVGENNALNFSKTESSDFLQ